MLKFPDNFLDVCIGNSVQISHNLKKYDDQHHYGHQLNHTALKQGGHSVKHKHDKSKYFVHYVCNTNHVSNCQYYQGIDINSVYVSHSNNRLPALKNSLKSAMQHQIKNPMKGHQYLTMVDVQGQHE